MFWIIIFGGLVLVLVAIALHYFYMTTVVFTYWKRRGIDYDPPTYPFGNLPVWEIFSKSSTTLLIETYKKIKGPFIGQMLYSRPALVLKDPEVINRILVKDFQYFNSRIEVDYSNDPLFGSIFVMNDERWKVFRHKFSPIFATNRLRDIFASIETNYQVLEDFIASNRKTDTITLDFYGLMKRYMVDVMAAVLLGIDVNYINNPNHEIRFMSDEVIPRTGKTMIKFFLSFLAPILKRKVHFNFFSKNCHNFVVELLDSMMKFRDENPTERYDFLHKLMEMRESDSNAQGFSIETLSAQLLLIFLAGYEATGTAISFCLWELAKNPKIQAKAQEEVDRVIAKHGKLTHEALKELTFIDNCLSETLRLHSPLTFLIRLCNEDYLCEKYNLLIEKNTTIIIPLPGLHRDEQYYENAQEFNPNRFLPEEKAKRPAGTYLPFGDGQRFCFGKQLGKIINVYTVGSLLHKYNLKLHDADLKLKPLTPILSPIDGIYITLVER